MLIRKPQSDIELVCAQLRAIVESEPGVPFSTLTAKYVELHGPLPEHESFGLPSLNALMKHAGLQNLGKVKLGKSFYLVGSETFNAACNTVERGCNAV